MPAPTEAIYGNPPAALAAIAADATQCSPLIPGSARLEDLAPGTLDRMVIAAPPGTIERRAVLALALRALGPAGMLTAMAPKDKGGTRLADELAAFGCKVNATPKRHQRIVTCLRPPEPAGLDATIAAGAPRFVAELGLWSQPGVFSFDRIDPASRLLMDHLPPMSGRGADLGCGIGVLAHAILHSDNVTHLTLVDIDRRAIDVARRNVSSDRVTHLWADARTSPDVPSGLDFVVMNPPFHDNGTQDLSLGFAFIARAAGCLRSGGELWLVANRHLPYEVRMRELFSTVEPIVDALGFKILAARR